MDNASYPRHPVPVSQDPRSWRLPERDGHCTWCGKELTGRRKAWCCDAHNRKYYGYFSLDGYRMRTMLKADGKCQACGKEVWQEGQMDHVIAICLGGDPWAEINLQLLCEKCHKKKTRSDMRNLANKRKGIIEKDLAEYFGG